MKVKFWIWSCHFVCSCSLFAAKVSEMDGGKEVRVEAAPYCCSTCDGEEVTCRNLVRRRRKTRSLSTSSASSCSEYRLVPRLGRYYRRVALNTKNQEEARWDHLWPCKSFIGPTHQGIALFPGLQAVGEIKVSLLWNLVDVIWVFWGLGCISIKLQRGTALCSLRKWADIFQNHNFTRCCNIFLHTVLFFFLALWISWWVLWHFTSVNKK